MKQQPHWVKFEVVMNTETHQAIHAKAAEQRISIPDLIKLAVESYNPPPIETGPDQKPNYTPYIVHPEALRLKSLDDMALCQTLHQPDPVPTPAPVAVPQKKRAA